VLSKQRGVAVALLVISVVALAAATLVQDPTGAHLELVPVFFGAAAGAAAVKLSRTRSGRD
jgi:hypothetical protein